jgi:hypothetical protein
MFKRTYINPYGMLIPKYWLKLRFNNTDIPEKPPGKNPPE